MAHHGITAYGVNIQNWKFRTCLPLSPLRWEVPSPIGCPLILGWSLGLFGPWCPSIWRISWGFAHPETPLGVFSSSGWGKVKGSSGSSAGSGDEVVKAGMDGALGFLQVLERSSLNPDTGISVTFLTVFPMGPSAVADLGGARGVRVPPLGTQILSISCSFQENLAKWYVGAPPLGELAPPWGNPGSAAVVILYM